MLKQYREAVEGALLRYSAWPELPALLRDSMQYGLLDGGKRIRPCLLLCVTEMLGGSTADALPFAAALEMIHCYSLIHDDLPAMDNDDYRRGKPSNHKAFGEGNAILAGDGLLTEAALLLSEQNGNDDAKRAILAAAMDMVAGQSIDLNEPERTKATLDELHRCKTGALFRAATLAGAYLAGRGDLADQFRALGERIGLLFQITDDLLDAEQDVKENKFTYVTFCGAEKSKEAALATEREILAELAPFENAAAEELKTVIRLLANRTA